MQKSQTMLFGGLEDEYFSNDTLNTILVEDLWFRRVINEHLYNYITIHQKRLKNKEHLRLTIQVNTNDDYHDSLLIQ